MSEMSNLLTTLTSKKEENALEKSHDHKKEEKETVELPKSPAPVDALKHYIDCPDCHKKINEKAKVELEPEILKSYREKVKSLKEPVICKDCGEIVEKREPKCTTCGNTEARTFKF